MQAWKPLITAGLLFNFNVREFFANLFHNARFLLGTQQSAIDPPLDSVQQLEPILQWRLVYGLPLIKSALPGEKEPLPADVLMHAICDAILGALGLGDIGSFFPNTDPRWHGAPSRVFLEEAARQAAARQGRIVNVDATLVAEQPKLLPHVQAMKANIATALNLKAGQVGVKATTNERLGFLGREEGIAAMAVASIDLP